MTGMALEAEYPMLRALERWSERTATGLAWLDGAGEVVWSNARWRALGGPAAGAWSVGLAARADAEVCLARARACGESVTLEQELAGRHLRLTLEAGPDGVMVTATDITAERREVEALLRLEERWRFALDGAGMGVWDWDIATGKVRVSSAWKRMHGVTEVRGIYEDWVDRLHPEDRERAIGLVQEHVLGEAPEYSSEHRIRRPDGVEVWVLDRGRVCGWGPDGAPRRVVGVVTELTPVVALRERLRESEERFRSAFEWAAIGKALVLPDGRFLAVNRSFCEITGYSEEELLTRDFQAITHPDDLAVSCARSEELLRGERGSFQLEKRYIRKDGRAVWVRLTESMIREADGRPKYFVSQVEDITARRAAEAALAASEARYRALVEASDDPIAAFDRDGRFLYANAATGRMWGRPPEALVGRSFADLLPPERAERRMVDLRAVFSAAHVVEVEREVPTAAGVRLYSVKGVPVADAAGVVTKVIMLGRDITEQRRIETERLAMVERAQKAQRLDSLSAMAGGVAHDLNNLLAVILGHADCARLDAPPNSDLSDSLDQIGDAARRAGELARQLLTVTGKAIRRPTQVGLPALVRDAAACLRPTLPRSCTIQLELAAAAVEGDPAQLRQVLTNLLLNAAQAIERVGGTITVRTGVRALGPGADGVVDPDLSEGTYAFVAVRDDGCGMTPEVQARVFEPFFSTKGSGRGLGLAVVHGVARGHHGSVRVVSEPGGGTEIEVLLPSSLPAQAVASPPAPEVETIRGQGLVLVIDDERAIRDSLRRSLMRLGFEVLAFESGQEALRFFRNDAPSVVLVVLDLLMPGMDGVEVLRELRKVRPDVQVVISSGFSGPLTLRDIHGAERVRFLPKPYGLDELQSVLHEVVGRTGEAAARAVMS